MIRRRIYTLNGLPPEVVAVAFAKCSRSPEPFDEIAAELNADKSRKFHEKWIVGYGHSSVAEHAVLSIAVEGVSILATKVIEDNRLASYTEKSTRYQIYDKDTYYKPKTIMDSPLSTLYEDTSDHIMDTYSEMVPVVLEYLKKKIPQEEDTSDALYNMRIKNMALDSCRYLLPVSTQTNLGITINARALEYALVKMKTHPLEEINAIGEDIKNAALKITPTLVKYVNYNKYLGETSKDLKELAKNLVPDIEAKRGKKVTLVEYDKDAEDKLITALLYRFSHNPYNLIKERTINMTNKEKEAVIDTALNQLGKFDKPLREFENIYYTFDIVVDYGAFRDIQRHRMATQTNQELTVRHGYCLPKIIIDAGLEKKYRECMEKAEETFKKIYERLPEEAQYIVPLGFNKRVLFTWNLRELFHFIPLRTGKTSHASYKKVAQEIYSLIKEKHPLLAKYITCHE